MKNSDSTSPERALFCREEGNRAHFQGRLMAPAAPGNLILPCFQGRVVPSPASEDVFSGAGEMLQYPAPVVGAEYICSCPWKKNWTSLEIISVVVSFLFKTGEQVNSCRSEEQKIEGHG